MIYVFFFLILNYQCVFIFDMFELILFLQNFSFDLRTVSITSDSQSIKKHWRTSTHVPARVRITKIHIFFNRAYWIKRHHLGRSTLGSGLPHWHRTLLDQHNSRRVYIVVYITTSNIFTIASSPQRVFDSDLPNLFSSLTLFVRIRYRQHIYSLLDN